VFYIVKIANKLCANVQIASDSGDFIPQIPYWSFAMLLDQDHTGGLAIPQLP